MPRPPDDPRKPRKSDLRNNHTISRAATGRLSPLQAFGTRWQDKQAGELLKSCTMIITEANGFVFRAFKAASVRTHGLISRWLMEREQQFALLDSFPNPDISH